MKTKNTELLKWLKTADDKAVAETGTTRAYLRMIAYGYKTASAEMAAGIERASQGLVTRKALRPNDWRLIWPELAAA
jgi:DNA-binding transcriptional regulator YdaS (Cro superfamily)